MNDRDILNFIIKALNTALEDTAEIDAADIQAELDDYEIETRICDTCGNLMIEGYCICEGDEYYCSDECMLEIYTQEQKDEILKDADTDEGTSYWTEWN